MVMLGSDCSPCCTQCGCPPSEQLPAAVTITFSGLTKSVTGKTGDLLGIKFSSCFGSGASATVAAPGGTADLGFPITSVTLASGGSGYAKLGRVEPVLSISGTGSGGAFTPTLTSSNDACGIPTWKIASVAVSKGTGYTNGEQLTVTVEDGGTEVAAAVLTVETNREEPTLSASASGGLGAVFSVTLSENYGSPTTWGVASVSVTSGGTGYSDGSQLSFSGGPSLKADDNATAYIATGRAVPTLTASVFGGGTGASISPTLTQYADWNGRDYWAVTGFTITNGGSGYAELDEVVVAIAEGKAGLWSYFYAYVSSVDEDGKILAIAIDSSGEYFKDTGIIESVEVWFGGSYYDDAGIPVSVSVAYGGQYFKGDANATPYVAEVTAEITQILPSDGTGASVTVTVDDQTSSPEFGKVVSLSLDTQGSGYLGWTWVLGECNTGRFNGRSFRLRRSSPGACDYLRCYGDDTIRFSYKGTNSPPSASITGSSCNVEFSALPSDGPFACSLLNVNVEDVLGGNATIEEGDQGAFPDCDAVFNADSVTLEIQAIDFWQKKEIKYNDNFFRRQAVLWPGSEYAGTYELTYYTTVTGSFYGTNRFVGSKVFRYYFSQTSLRCQENAYVELIARASPPLLEWGLFNMSVLWHTTNGNITTDIPSSCETLNAEQDFFFSERKGWVVSSGNAAARCACDPSSLSPIGPSLPGFVVSSDFPTTTTNSGLGGLVINAVFVSLSNNA